VRYIARILLLVVLGVALFAGPASAQSTDDGTYVEGNQTDTGDPDLSVDPLAEPAGADVLSANTEAESSSLPVTGGDIATLVGLAMVLVVGGGLLVVVRHRRLTPVA
jgi:LPXTG-motif cell wall-anchored protein